ncbi:MAG: ComF family protein [Clostridia bacterium]|nr:ComF family protein [Clostridia bacterium]
MTSGIRRILAHICGWMDELLFPENVLCLCCDHALGEEDELGVCPDCRRELARLAAGQEAQEAAQNLPCPAGVDYVHAAFIYEGAARQLIHRLKYDGIRQAALPLAQRMSYLPSGEEEIIVPVPTDPVRERRRGFNQSALLAEHIAKELGMQMETAVVRIRASRPQTGLSARERRENLAGCMAAGDVVRGRRVLLVDDVVTTGATAGEAARALLAAGAKSVGMFAAARAAADGDELNDPFAPEIRKR